MLCPALFVHYHSDIFWQPHRRAGVPTPHMFSLAYSLCVTVSFGTVTHSKLQCKLNPILNNLSLVQWISNFRTERTQTVCFNSAESSTTDDSSGVPQGSVLGPLLFLLYNNDLPNNITSSILLCVISSNHISQIDRQVLDESFANFCSWCNKWQMKINFNKTVVLTFSTRTSPKQFCN